MAQADELHSGPWYHCIRLADGSVTPGLFATHEVADQAGLPQSLAGKRCLDVGSCDGFWAFEMERRGAAEVVALDVDDTSKRDWPVRIPPEQRAADSGKSRRNFTAVKELLGSKVERVDLSVYDISEERLGRFDFVFMGSLLLHLRDPILALEGIRTVVDEHFLSNDSFSPTLSALRPNKPVAWLSGVGTSRWWTVNLAGRKRMIEAAGFDIVDSGPPYVIRFGHGHRTPGLPSVPRSLRAVKDEVEHQVLGRIGAPTQYILSRPSPNAWPR